MQPLGAWALDRGVSYASSGTPLTPVAGTPTTGQYSVSAGIYTFSPGDAGKAVLISYGYIPTAGGVGLALAAVKGTPALGQYSVSNGVYAFSAADTGQPVLISYGYVPQTWRRRRSNWRPSGFAPPSASASVRSRWAVRKRSPTT